MTYDTGKRLLHTGVFERIKLSPSEHRLLVCLSSGDTTTYDKIAKYVYGLNPICDFSRPISKLLSDFKHKTKGQVRIRTIKQIGCRLETEIYFK